MKNTVVKLPHTYQHLPKGGCFVLPAPIVLRASDESYPRRLREPRLENINILHAVGNLDLLNTSAVAIIGSRHCSDRGLHLATGIGGAIARSGVAVVSGYATGIDTAAHRGALQSQGGTVFVLPFGISHFRVKRDLRALLRPSNFLALSQFPPKQRWFASAAMKRNRLVCALVEAVVVIEAGERGGTIDGAVVAKELGKPLYVIQYSSPPPSAVGNEFLLSQLSASPLRNWRDVNAFIENFGGNHVPALSSSPDFFQESLF